MKEDGQLYSELYLDQKGPSDDSEVFRARLGYYLDTKMESQYKSQIANAYKLRKGVNINSDSLPMGLVYRFEEFLTKCTVVQALDLITISGKTLHENRYRETNQYGKFIKEVFREENLQYKLDASFGVHPLIDIEFQHAKEATLKALNEPKYSTARHEFDRCYDFISATNPDYKLAIRSVFECAEIIVKDALKSQNLSKFVIEKILLEKLQLLYSNDETNKQASILIASQFSNWVEACHYYRHGQPTENPMQPSTEIAILLISSGASFIRWLLDILPRTETNT